VGSGLLSKDDFNMIQNITRSHMNCFYASTNLHLINLALLRQMRVMSWCGWTRCI